TGRETRYTRGQRPESVRDRERDSARPNRRQAWKSRERGPVRQPAPGSVTPRGSSSRLKITKSGSSPCGNKWLIRSAALAPKTANSGRYGRVRRQMRLSRVDYVRRELRTC